MHQLHQWETSAVLQPSHVCTRARGVQTRGNRMVFHWLWHGPPRLYRAHWEGINQRVTDYDRCQYSTCDYEQLIQWFFFFITMRLRYRISFIVLLLFITFHTLMHYPQIQFLFNPEKKKKMIVVHHLNRHRIDDGISLRETISLASNLLFYENEKLLPLNSVFIFM